MSENAAQNDGIPVRDVDVRPPKPAKPTAGGTRTIHKQGTNSVQFEPAGPPVPKQQEYSHANNAPPPQPNPVPSAPRTNGNQHPSYRESNLEKARNEKKRSREQFQQQQQRQYDVESSSDESMSYSSDEEEPPPKRGKTNVNAGVRQPYPPHRNYEDADGPDGTRNFIDFQNDLFHAWGNRLYTNAVDMLHLGLTSVLASVVITGVRYFRKSLDDKKEKENLESQWYNAVPRVLTEDKSNLEF
jgi:hypothetical protein